MISGLTIAWKFFGYLEYSVTDIYIVINDIYIVLNEKSIDLSYLTINLS